MRTTLTCSRRNVALIVSSAGLALVGLGGGVAVALTAGGDDGHEMPPVLVDPGTADRGRTDQGQTDQGQTRTGTQAHLPSVQSVCSGQVDGEQVGQPEEGTLDDGSKFIAHTFNIDGFRVTVMDENDDQSIESAFVDTD